MLGDEGRTCELRAGPTPAGGELGSFGLLEGRFPGKRAAWRGQRRVELVSGLGFVLVRIGLDPIHEF